jgi:hypothetical protein
MIFVAVVAIRRPGGLAYVGCLCLLDEFEFSVWFVAFLYAKLMSSVLTASSAKRTRWIEESRSTVRVTIHLRVLWVVGRNARFRHERVCGKCRAPAAAVKSSVRAAKLLGDSYPLSYSRRLWMFRSAR